jgi:hypothetical protein
VLILGCDKYIKFRNLNVRMSVIYTFTSFELDRTQHHFENPIKKIKLMNITTFLLYYHYPARYDVKNIYESFFII